MGMFGKRFQLNEETIHIVEEIGRHMPGGFFIYKKEMPEELLYANRAVLNIFGCKNLEEFKELTGYTFKGMLHPDDYDTVSETIQRQVQENEEFMDYVEYRIIRRDGAVRWVDDYGHYTDTEAYGGIYYVFISDITEMHERMESDKIIQQALIDALSESYRALWLLKDPESDDYERYIRNEEGILVPDKPELNGTGLADYAEIREYYIRHTVVPEDQERLRAELSRDRILSRLKERPHFSISYQRLMKDGSHRYYRIEVARANMPDGRIGVVLGFRDVDEDVRDWQALQQQLQAQQLLRERQDKLITALSSDYWSVYYIELDKDEGVCYQDHADIKDGLKVGERFPYLATVTEYANKYVTESYREEFLRFTCPDAIREALKEERVIAFRYMVSRNGKETYEMTKIAGVRHPEDRDDHIVHAVGLCFTDVDAETRKNMETAQTLNDALATAEQANRAKTAFLSSMSHEIRTPMNAIIGYTNLALQEQEVSRLHSYLEKIQGSSQHLLELINDILEMSRIESGKVELEFVPVDLCVLFEGMRDLFSEQMRQKSMDFQVHTGQIQNRYVWCDKKNLNRVLLNVLSNAYKFTPEGGTITASVWEVSTGEGGYSSYEIRVQDNGIGMSREFAERMFNAFERERTSTVSGVEGTGLGMSITKRIVDLMGGTIEVMTAPGTGTEIIIRLRFRLAEADQVAERAEEAGHVPDRSGGNGTEMDFSQYRLLLVEDNAVNLEIAFMILTQAGFRVETAVNGQEAVNLVRASSPGYYDAILMDIQMPVMDGYEATKEIRGLADRALADIPILAMTANAFKEDVEASKAAGMQAHIAKPIDVGAMLHTLRDVLGGAGD